MEKFCANFSKQFWHPLTVDELNSITRLEPASAKRSRTGRSFVQHCYISSRKQHRLHVDYHLNVSDSGEQNPKMENPNYVRDNSTNSPPATDQNPGLDWAGIVIIFVVVIFAVLIIYLIVYFYIIKGMKQKSASRPTIKSSSGSVNEEKARNIFAHPERQLAVDQSTRMHSPSGAIENQTDASSANNQPTPTSAPSSNASSDTRSHQSEPAVARKSKSGGKRNPNGTDNHDHHTFVGALAGLRDTLKETELHK